MGTNISNQEAQHFDSGVYTIVIRSSDVIQYRIEVTDCNPIVFLNGINIIKVGPTGICVMNDDHKFICSTMIDPISLLDLAEKYLTNMKIIFEGSMITNLTTQLSNMSQENGQLRIENRTLTEKEGKLTKIVNYYGNHVITEDDHKLLTNQYMNDLKLVDQKTMLDEVSKGCPFIAIKGQDVKFCDRSTIVHLGMSGYKCYHYHDMENHNLVIEYIKMRQVMVSCFGVTISLDGKPIEAQFDTGATTSVFNFEMMHNKPKNFVKLEDTDVKWVNGLIMRFNRSAGDIRIGDVTLENHPYVIGEPNLIGLDIMWRFESLILSKKGYHYQISDEHQAIKDYIEKSFIKIPW